MKGSLLMAGLLSGILSVFGCGKSSKAEYKVVDTYNGLREQVLRLDPKTIGLNESSSNRIWAILMETGYPEAVATLVTVADGTVSLYFSNGGAIIGVGQHDEPRKAGNDLLKASPQFLQHAKPTKEFPLPEIGHTRFYFMTFDGAYTVDSVEDDLGKNRSPLSPLFYKAQDVITQARFAEEKTKESTIRILHAATVGDATELRSLLNAGVSANMADETGLTPLMASSYAGKIDTARLLLDSGAQIDAIDKVGYTALMYACNAGHKGCAEMLVAKGSDVNHRDNDDSTPIMFAAQNAHNDIVRLLLAHGADPQFKGKHGLSALGFARQNGHSETERILTSGN